MRMPSHLVPFAALVLVAVASAEDPLLKPVAPPSTSVRVRVQFGTENAYTGSQIKARVPRAKAKGGDLIDATVAFDTLPGKGAVSAKKWKSWGYEVPANKVGVLPEIVIPAAQLAPKSPKGRDVEVKFPAIALEIVDTPGDSDLVYGSDLYLRLSDLTKNADRAFEPRFYFGDKFLELTAPRGAVKRLDTGDGTPPEPAASADDKLVPVAGAMMVRGSPVFAFASVNGLPQYKLPDGKMQTVDVAVSSNSNWEGGILMTLGTARGCGVEFDDGKTATGIGAGFETMIVKGKVKEFRLGFRTGTGFKDQKDLVLKDATVYIDKANSGHFVWLGSKFVGDNLTDAVYTCGSDGGWKLLGRAKPDALQDVKTRTPPKK
jgi:hypothetical protein